MSIGTRLRKKMKVDPRRYQVQGVRFLEQANGRALLADDMGLGKTFQVIGWLALHPEVRPVIVVCPAPLKYNWQRELWKHARIRSEVLEGKTPYKSKSQILLINYEILQDWVEGLKKLNPLLVVFDECHYVKNRSAKRTRSCGKLAAKCKYVIALSGTPITNAPVEFYPILRMIKPKLFESFHEYAWAFCDPQRGFRGSWDYRGASNLKKLRRLVSPFMLRRLKREVLTELPPKRRILIPVEITNRKEYVKARDDFVDWLATKEGVAAVQSAKGALALVRMGKLKQIAAEGKLKTAIQWIKDFQEESGEKLVIFAIHKRVIEGLKKAFPKAALLTGTTPKKKRQQEVDRFQEDPKCRELIGQLKVAGEGHTLTAASTTLTLEIGWNEAIHNQAEDRTNRLGQKSKKGCKNYYLVARNTIEEWLLEVIHEKQVAIDKVLEGGKAVGRTSLLKMLERFE